ncbi:HlyD family efflux transporter periplasmic adaptor subunit [Verrucomicrobiaceae bacterium R5-34]|nr:HlyD family efflux transporter periplasmic adaptor subunit [Verrucomicrobiaceae bacterium R5-34]
MITRSTLTALCLTGMLPTLATAADEYSVTEKPFKKEVSLTATFLPTQSTAISVDPAVWTDFEITSLVSQGAVVKKGDTLIGIDSQKIDEQIDKMEKDRVIGKLNLAKAQQELASLEITTPRSLESHARAAKEAAENLKWFKETGLPLSIEATKNSVINDELNLAYQLEELKQLEKMYKEDDKIEETEEIILTRTRNSVKRAKFGLKSSKLSSARKLETELPRQLKSYELAAENSRIANENAKATLPRALELKRKEVAKAEKADAEADAKLTKLKADRALMNIQAPGDGVVYYGSIRNGRWSATTAVKVLKVGGKLPASTPLMTFIPAKTPLMLSAFAKEDKLSALKKGLKGFAITHLNRYQNIPVTITGIDRYPQTDGSFHVSLSVDSDTQAVTGMTANVKLVASKIAQAITVPADYLTREDDGSYSVKLKLADGKTEARKVVVADATKDTVVITEGLYKAQVIVK